MSNEIILRYACAVLIITVLFLIFLWRTAAEDAQEYRRRAEQDSETLAEMTHQIQRLKIKIEILIQLQTAIKALKKTRE